MSVYFTDEVIITPVSRDANFRNEVLGTPFSSEAYTEKDDKIMYDDTGMPIRPARKIFLPLGTNISEGFYIRVSKKSGVDYTDSDRVVRSVELVGSFRLSHIEVIS